VADRLVHFRVDLIVLDATPYLFGEDVVASASPAVYRQLDVSAQNGLGEHISGEPAVVSRIYKVALTVVRTRLLDCLDTRTFDSRAHGSTIDLLPISTPQSRFHFFSWFRDTSNCYVNSAIFRAQFCTAIATFALNASECVSRILFVISRIPFSALAPAHAFIVALIGWSELARLAPRFVGGEHRVKFRVSPAPNSRWIRLRAILQRHQPFVPVSPRTGPVSFRILGHKLRIRVDQRPSGCRVVIFI